MLAYLENYPITCQQTIEFGKNLIDFTRSWDSTQFATVLLPLGKRLESKKRKNNSSDALDEYLTIEEVNKNEDGIGSIYLQSPDAVASYGRIEKTVSWDDVDDANGLLEYARKYLSELQFEDMVIELSAMDLHYLDVSIDDVGFLDNIMVSSPPHGLNKLFPVTKLTIPLDSPEKTQFTLGRTVRTSLTGTSEKISADIQRKIDALPKEHSILDKARQYAAAIMDLATTGYITIVKNENGTGSDALYISNTPDYKTATQYWKWSMNGLAYYGPDNEKDENGKSKLVTAITMDGGIVADFINTGTMSADRVRGGILESSDENQNVVFDLKNGKLTMKRGSIYLGDYSNDSKHYQFEVNEDGSMYAGSSAIFAGNVYAKAFYDENGRLVFHDGRIDESYLNLDKYKADIAQKFASVVYAPSGDQTISLFDYGDPTKPGYDAKTYAGQYYKDVTTGILYYSNGSSWINKGASYQLKDGEEIALFDFGPPTKPGYDAGTYAGEYYMNTLTGEVWYSDGTQWIKQETPSQTRFLQDLSGFQFTITEGEDGITYGLTKNGGYVISSQQKRQYSLTGQDGTWKDTWDDSWAGNAVYARNSYDGGATWGTAYVFQGLVGSNGKDAYTVMLNNNPHVFAGDVDHAVAGNVTVGVLAFKGDTRVAATIGTIDNQPNGMTAKPSEKDNGTINASFTVNVTTALTTPSGTLTVPVTVDGKSFTLYWSWSIAFKGATGATGSNANVDFEAVNKALGNLFKKVTEGQGTTFGTDYIFSPEISAGKIYGLEIYAGQGNGFSQMSETGLDVYSSESHRKIHMGWATGTTEYPYLMLGIGTNNIGSDAGVIQKLGDGLWIGDAAMAASGGNKPSGKANGIFIDFSSGAQKVYKYINGNASELGEAVFG